MHAAVATVVPRRVFPHTIGITTAAITLVRAAFAYTLGACSTSVPSARVRTCADVDRSACDRGCGNMSGNMSHLNSEASEGSGPPELFHLSLHEKGCYSIDAREFKAIASPVQGPNSREVLPRRAPRRSVQRQHERAGVRGGVHHRGEAGAQKAALPRQVEGLARG